MIADSEFGEAVKFLEQSLEESDEPTLRLLLDQAIEGRESLRKQVEAGLATAAKMARAGRSSEAIHFLQAQPPAVLRSERLQTAISALDEEQQQAVFRMIGRAYTALQTELPAGENTIQWVAAAFGNSPFAVSVTDAFHARMHAFADRTIQDLISRCKIMLRNRDRAGSAELAKQASGVIDYAGSQAQADWRNLVDRTARSGLLTRLRK